MTTEAIAPSRTREYKRDQMRRWRKNNPERSREYRRQYYLSNGNIELVVNFARRYGLTTDEARSLLDAKPSVCDVCGGPGTTRGITYDHDHATGGHRGWLCTGCNAALGHAHDSPEVLRKLADYLERP